MLYYRSAISLHFALSLSHKLSLHSSCLKYLLLRVSILTLNHCFWPKYESIIHNNASSSEKVHLLLFSHIKIHWHICLELCWTVFACKRCLVCVYFSPDLDKTAFSLENAIWYKKVLTINLYMLYNMLIDRMDYLWIIVMLLSAVWSLILTAPIHYSIIHHIFKKQLHAHYRKGVFESSMHKLHF